VLKVGDYHVDIKDNGKQKVEVPAKVENGSEKYRRNKVLYNQDNGKMVIQEIQIGGTNTKLTFDSGVQTGGGL
jgi:hypothetical protein